jgi:hypothetical protein
VRRAGLFVGLAIGIVDDSVEQLGYLCVNPAATHVLVLSHRDVGVTKVVGADASRQRPTLPSIALI